MKIVQKGETIGVTGIEQLAAANAGAFASALLAALHSRPQQVDIDLSETGFVDCVGVGALVAVRKCARRRNADATVRLLNPALPARCLLKLTGLDAFFPIEAY